MALQSRIPQIQREIPKAIATANERSAGYVADLGEQLAPEDTGGLKGTVRSQPIEGGAPTDFQALAGDPGATNSDGKPIDYAVHVEFGTEASDAQPFMGPAAKAIDHGKEAAAELRRAIGSNAL